MPDCGWLWCFFTSWMLSRGVRGVRTLGRVMLVPKGKVRGKGHDRGRRTNGGERDTGGGLLGVGVGVSKPPRPGVSYAEEDEEEDEEEEWRRWERNLLLSSSEEWSLSEAPPTALSRATPKEGSASSALSFIEIVLSTSSWLDLCESPLSCNVGSKDALWKAESQSSVIFLLLSAICNRYKHNFS